MIMSTVDGKGESNKILKYFEDISMLFDVCWPNKKNLERETSNRFKPNNEIRKKLFFFY